MTRILDVYLHEQLTGTLTEEYGDLSFLYNPHAKIAVSYSLPLQDKPHIGQAVKAFFSGLLPDDIVRHRLARVLGVFCKKVLFSAPHALAPPNLAAVQSGLVRFCL